MSHDSSFSLFVCHQYTYCHAGITCWLQKNLPDTPHLPKSLALTKQVQERHQMVKHGGSSDGLISAINAQSHHHPNQSGYYPITTGANAFAARSTLTDVANQSIDIQYYIWHNDEAGQLMLKDLWEAADRGVIVRLLLDDFNSSPELDQLLLRISKHKNIAVRLINPMPYRGFRSLNYMLHPIRTNRRMHNKSMTFDNKISVIGGRNIGNEYLNNAPVNHFADLDVMLVGHVVGKITQSFEIYWASPLSFDIETLVKHDNKDDISGIKPVVFDELEKKSKTAQMLIVSYALIAKPCKIQPLGKIYSPSKYHFFGQRLI